MGLKRKSIEIKRLARGKMLDNYGTAIGAYILRALVVSALLFISSTVVDSSSMFGAITYFLMTVIVSLLAVTLDVGELTIYLNLACGGKAKAFDIFKGLRINPDRTILIALIIMIRSGIYLVIANSIIYLAYLKYNNTPLAVLALILLIIALIIYIYVRLKLSQCYYMILDFPDMGVLDILRKSANIMKGNKMRLCKLYLSFIPMLLLGILGMGLASLYIYPYIRMSLTEFYFDLMGQKEDVKVGGGFDAYVDDSIKIESAIEKE